MKILVLEDNRESRRALDELLTRISDEIEVLAAATRAEADEIVKNNDDISLFLLDINMDMHKSDDVTGFTFAKEVREIQAYEFIPIVFITSIVNLEVPSYREAQCYSYITKPFRRSEVEKIVRKVMSHTEVKEDKTITVKKDGVNYRIKTNDIISIQAIMRGVRLNMGKEQMDVRYLTLKQIQDKLDSPDFIQCHRMYIINTTQIEYVDAVNQLIKMKGQKEPVEIGITYKAAIKNWL